MKGLILSFLLVIPLLSPAQDLIKYSINWGDDSIGVIEARKTLMDDGEFHYVINSSSSFRVVFKFHLTFDYFCSFLGDSLTRASAIRKMNGDEKERSWVVPNGNSYQGYADGDELIINEPISYAISMMYFEEPVHVQKVFSERFSQHVELKRDKEKRYILELPNGSTTKYTYTDGICKKVEVETKWADLVFHRISSL